MKERGNSAYNIFETIFVKKKKMENYDIDKKRDFPKAFFSLSAIIITSNFP